MRVRLPAERCRRHSTLPLTCSVKHFSYRRVGKRRIHETPKVGQINACRPWLKAEIEAVQPKLVVCLGSTAARSVLGSDVRVLRDRGQVLERDGLAGKAEYVVTVHPSAILRAPDDTRDEAFKEFVSDLAVVRDRLSG